MATTKKKIRIMTDSVCDIPQELLEKWNIGVIPCYVNFEGKSYLDDGKQFDRAEFYRRLPQMKEFPTTAAPSPALAEEMLKEAIEGYDHIVSINVAAKLSATLNNVRLGGQQGLPERVTVLDSGGVTMSIGSQALVAARVAAETGSVEAVVAAVESARKRQKLYAIIANLEYLRRSGRVNAISAFAGSILQIKPILDVHDGEVDVAERIRTMGKAVSRLRELTEAQAPLESLTILHIENENGANELKESLKGILPPEVITVVAGPTLGVHIGPGSLGVVTIRKS
jgi:DegV family protein with EDD domain